MVSAIYRLSLNQTVLQYYLTTFENKSKATFYILFFKAVADMCVLPSEMTHDKFHFLRNIAYYQQMEYQHQPAFVLKIFLMYYDNTKVCILRMTKNLTYPPYEIVTSFLIFL